MLRLSNRSRYRPALRWNGETKISSCHDLPGFDRNGCGIVPVELLGFPFAFPRTGGPFIDDMSNFGMINTLLAPLWGAAVILGHCVRVLQAHVCRMRNDDRG